jgi:hypothetical protein
MTARCAEEEQLKILFIASSVGIVGLLLIKIIINAMKMSHNQNAPSAWKFLNILQNTTEIFLVDT